MMRYFRVLIAAMTLSGLTACTAGEDEILQSVVGEETLELAIRYLDEQPLTVTASFCPRSAGGIHDFYSEGDYWWPDPQNPDGPYIRRDGESNPDNFSDHRHAMVRFSDMVATFTSAYLLTGDSRYADAAQKHLSAWFIDPSTLMNPSLMYAQAIKGRATGRGIGIIDSLHLIEVAQSVMRLAGCGAINQEVLAGVREWFSTYLTWMMDHPYGVQEMNQKNNHGTCWALQAASFARLAGNSRVLEMCRSRYKNVFLPEQVASDGSFPLELARTKPYGYSLFNLDAMAGLCQVLSTPDDDLWIYETEDGRSISKAVEFMLPYIADKSVWPFAHDVSHWDEWPVAQPALLFYGVRFGDKRCLELWKALEHFPGGNEIIRNLPIRHPLIWLYKI